MDMMIYILWHVSYILLAKFTIKFILQIRDGHVFVECVTKRYQYLFLPPDIDISGDEVNSVSLEPIVNSETGCEAHMNVHHEPDSPWIEVNYTKSSRSKRKIDFVIK